ncbi:hypothetical protein [Methanocella arvoryzae]|uniref:Uncharacterized protein n=1 Tax=Methanocella arvoryzae (strain DSM 22066 / NBRC 105507 / MRE50) TaxID=351160 RepID=Q0W7M5_METAR|nr:hypothetical protein [Methanocella arvoryzae]CAJ35618.1 hypothetical protein RCIX118 [Methanocella arvoryzae MRE50]
MHKQVSDVAEGCIPVATGSICRKCSSSRIKVIYFEKEGKKFAVCEDCGDIRSVGSSLQDCYEKWKSYREAPPR